MKKRPWLLPVLLLAGVVANAQVQTSDETAAIKQMASVAVQSALAGRWTGGFWLRGNWAMVNLRFNSKNESPSALADMILPSYSASQSAINVPLQDLTQSSDGLHFAIPIGEQKVIFDGHWKDVTISGNYDYNGTKGSFGLTNVANVTVESLEKYYGAYRVSPDRVISIFRGWDSPRSLNYVDYETGEVGTLWPSAENEFFAGAGLAVSFPVVLRASFDRDASGRTMRVRWRSLSGAALTARKIEVREERLTFKNGDITIGGTLILPATKGRHPVVIVTPGDYGTNRNQLRLWAHNFVSRGIAALVFDSRGAGESTGTIGLNSFSDLANDVLAGVQVLKTRDDINPREIGLFGFSNSAWTVSLAAGRSKDVSFLILQSFGGVQPWKQESFRAETQLRVDKFSESRVKQGADFMRLKFEVARTGKGWEKLQEIMEQARGESWLAYTNPPGTLERLRQSYEATMTYDPVPALEKLKIPVLAFWGEKDTYVPVKESVTSFEKAMARVGNKSYVIKIYPNGTHSLFEDDTGSASTGGKEKNFVAGFWKMKTDWLLNHLSRKQ